MQKWASGYSDFYVADIQDISNSHSDLKKEKVVVKWMETGQEVDGKVVRKW